MILHVVSWALTAYILHQIRQSNEARGCFPTCKTAIHDITSQCVLTCVTEAIQVSVRAFFCTVKRDWVLKGTHYKSHWEKLNVSYTDPFRSESESQGEPGGLYLNPESHRSGKSEHVTGHDLALTVWSTPGWSVHTHTIKTCQFPGEVEGGSENWNMN